MTETVLAKLSKNLSFISFAIFGSHQREQGVMLGRPSVCKSACSAIDRWCETLPSNKLTIAVTGGFCGELRAREEIR
jgi:hypothetical protein